MPKFPISSLTRTSYQSQPNSYLQITITSKNMNKNPHKSSEIKSQNYIQRQQHRINPPFQNIYFSNNQQGVKTAYIKIVGRDSNTKKNLKTYIMNKIAIICKNLYLTNIGSVQYRNLATRKPVANYKTIKCPPKPAPQRNIITFACF